ncbi:radical SAM/SPASM domain-containing protein [Clostridium oryzae]|uniref:Antilisterial bacteriocin subtilosin biosynthesis protein AlbA n=1 Tax=Clostridium oryzae TaxID=1450648 RepID=A0A1V4IW93_9CLOT|nr:radical SAM protein [Clostridium oryzae]OPJ64169.1 antilisterial bacteriocin subtilosin biosynthesis protein AlbA [Clostridium oryzae]
MRKYKFSENIRINYKDKFAILASEESRSWIKVSKECLDILKKFLELEYNHDEIIDSFEQEQDKQYFGMLLDKLLEIKVLKDKGDLNNNRMMSLDWFVTKRCNLTCSHCCVDALDSVRQDLLDTEDMLKIVDKIADIGLESITITGGEPLIRKDIWEIISYLRSKFNGKLGIMTNSLLINKDNIKHLKKFFDDISISIDGVDEESCSIIRGNNVYSRVIEKIQYLKSEGVENISVSAILPNNPIITDEFEKLNKRLGTKPMIRYFSYSGRAAKNHNTILKNMNQYLKKRNMGESDIINWARYIPYNKKEVLPGNCGACIENITVDVDGTLYPCNSLVSSKYGLGNLLEIADLKEYLIGLNVNRNKGYKNLRKLKNCSNEHCNSCNVKAFCWSCPAECEDLLQNKELFMKRCEQVRNKLTDVVWGE